MVMVTVMHHILVFNIIDFSSTNQFSSFVKSTLFTWILPRLIGQLNNNAHTLHAINNRCYITITISITINKYNHYLLFVNYTNDWWADQSVSVKSFWWVSALTKKLLIGRTKILFAHCNINKQWWYLLMISCTGTITVASSLYMLMMLLFWFLTFKSANGVFVFIFHLPISWCCFCFDFSPSYQLGRWEIKTEHTTKFSCVNAKGILTMTYQVLHLLPKLGYPLAGVPPGQVWGVPEVGTVWWLSPSTINGCYITMTLTVINLLVRIKGSLVFEWNSLKLPYFTAWSTSTIDVIPLLWTQWGYNKAFWWKECFLYG